MKREPYVLMNYASAAMEENQWNEAVTAYNTAIGTDMRPNTTGGTALLSSSECLDPNRPTLTRLKAMAHVGLGQFKLKMGSYTEAVHEFTLATKIEPRLALPYRNLANALKLSGKPSEAQAALRKANRLEAQ